MFLSHAARPFGRLSVAALFLGTVLVGCGQKGALYIPQTPAAAQRATLPQTATGSANKKNKQAAKHEGPSSPAPSAAPNIE